MYFYFTYMWSLPVFSIIAHICIPPPCFSFPILSHPASTSDHWIPNSQWDASLGVTANLTGTHQRGSPHYNTSATFSTKWWPHAFSIEVYIEDQDPLFSKSSLLSSVRSGKGCSPTQFVLIFLVFSVPWELATCYQVILLCTKISVFTLWSCPVAVTVIPTWFFLSVIVVFSCFSCEFSDRILNSIYSPEIMEVTLKSIWKI